MKTHTEDYKKSLIGKREIKSELKYVEDNKVKTLKEDDIETIKPILNTDLFKSVMKQLDIESKIPLALNTIVNYKNGLKVNGEYEYINYGSYIVYETEYRADTNTYYHICYDKMLYAMEQYKPLTITYPITVREYINTLANSINLNFALKNEIFVNYNKQILKEHFDNGVYTYRDIFDYLSEVVGGWLYIDNNNNLSIKYPTETNETFNADFLEQVNIDFNNKYGPVNSIVFARANETDNIEYKDDESIAENGLYRIKFSDNPILSDTNRNDYLSQELKEKIIGIEYYLIDIVNKGITYLELGDYFNYILSDKVIDALKSGLVKSGLRKAQDKTKLYKCLLLNDEITINSGIKESIYSYEPEQNEQEYMTTAPSDNSIKNAEILVNKNAGELILKANSNGKVVQARLDADADDGSVFEIQADNIDLTGYVTVNDLSGTGTTTIDGSNITTGTIKSQNYVSGTSGTSINLSDGSIDTKNFKLDSSGNMTTYSGTFGGTLNTNQDCTVGENLYIGQNQSSSISDIKYLYFSNDSFIRRAKQPDGEILEAIAKKHFILNTADDEGSVYLGQHVAQLSSGGSSNNYFSVGQNSINASRQITIDSDKRLKKEIKNINTSWIDELKVKEFEYKNNEGKQIGLIAQDYIDKDYSKYFLNKKEDGYYSIAYGNITNALIQYCQEMKQEINSLKEEIKQLKESDK